CDGIHARAGGRSLAEAGGQLLVPDRDPSPVIRNRLPPTRPRLRLAQVLGRAGRAREPCTPPVDRPPVPSEPAEVLPAPRMPSTGPPLRARGHSQLGQARLRAPDGRTDAPMGAGVGR